MKCFYHTDMDGKCAGAIVYQYYRNIADNFPKEFIAIDYRGKFPFEKISPDETVVIVDFSLEKEGEFDKLLSITNNVIWIDHHITAIEKNKHLENKVKGIRKDGTAGCVLTWNYFYPNKKLPRIVDMLGAYDVWNFSVYGDELNKLQSGIRLYDNKPESDEWINWLNTERESKELDGVGYLMDNLTTLLEKGSIILDYRNKNWESQVKTWSFLADFEGHKAICCNMGSVSSQFFDSIKEDYDLMIPFVYDGIEWKISLYTKKDIDCSEIAKKYGGGGHKKAAGFQVKELPFKRKED